jgi:thiol:disulfide interchange protein DsbC|tara:strand:- start:2221 stop:2847 length:627 start_codon:yes stop_codon:yes gene_type:complete
MSEIFPTIKYDKIKKTPVKNIYEIHYGGEIVYVTEDGRYIFESGNLQKIEKAGEGFVFINLTEVSASQGRKNLLSRIPDSKLFVYGDSKKNYINVVTDIDCPYCRKFHKDIPIYLENNIKVRYLVFAIKTSAKKKVISAWCSSDRNKAFSLLKNEEKIKSMNCENPINEHQELISSIGVGSTPSIFLPDGSLILGYMSPEEIIEKIKN